MKYMIWSLHIKLKLYQKLEKNVKKLIAFKNILINVRNYFYLTFFKGGNLLTDYEIIHLWKILPFEYKIKNASIIY